MRISLTGLLALILFFSCCSDQKKQAPLFDNLGTLNFPITTNSTLAQKYFDQGVILAYGFNHEEAFRSFEKLQDWIQIVQWLIGEWLMCLVRI